MQSKAPDFTCGFIGLGLIGGSIARALKRQRTAKIIVYDPDSETLAAAKKVRVADVITETIDRTFLSCDVIFLSAPASQNIFNLRLVVPFLKPDTILTDVSGVKEPIHRMAQELKLGAFFVGGHPMAGSEQAGFGASAAKLLNGATYILTKTADTDPARLARMEQLVRLTGAVPLVMDASAHDRAAAAVSHLPHVISAALVNLISMTDDENGTMKQIAAGGFKDLTRISSSSPEMWRQITLLNSTQISCLLAEYIGLLQDTKKKIDQADADAMDFFFTNARNLRDRIGK